MSSGLQLVAGFLSVALFVFCDFTVTRWAELLGTNGIWSWRLAIVLIVAPLGIVCFGLVGAKMGLAAVSGFVNTGVVVGGVLIGLAIREEQLTICQKLGLACGIISILLINMGRRVG